MFDALTNLLAVFRFGWSDLLDIAIVSFLIYQFLSIIRHTRAVQIIVGGIFVVALYYASELVTLRTDNWVVGEMFGYAVFGYPGIWISGYPAIRVPGYLDIRNSGYPAIRVSGYSGIRVSGYPAIRISGYPNIRISGYPDI